MKRLLVTGASGFLGWHICNRAPEGYDVYGTVFSHRVRIPNTTTLRVDLTSSAELKRLFNDVRPDAVIHTAAVSDINLCQVERMRSYRLNVESSARIASLCADHMVPYLFTSSDLVFDGMKAPYRESDPVCPVNVYGEHKVQAEDSIRRYYPDAAVCRMSLMFGRSAPAAKSFIQPMIRAMKEGEELKLFVDEFRTPLSARAAVMGLFLVLHRVSGIVHLGGSERISRYEFGRLMQNVFKMGRARITPCRQTDLELQAPRPADVSLDSSKAGGLGFKPASLIEELQQINACV
jgi:dTDP-4-dehydrorhamnose reductase